MGESRSMSSPICLAAAAVLMVVGVTACGDDAGGSGPSGGTLVLGASAGPLQEGYMKCAVEPFQRETGITVRYQAGSGAENIAIVAAQKQNPPIDVMMGNDGNEYAGRKADVFEVLDKSKLPNLESVDPEFMPKSDLAMPLGTSVGGIEYNTEVFQQNGWDPPTSFNDFWDPKYAGHVSLLDLSNSYGMLFLAAIADLNGSDGKDFGPAFDRLAELKPNLHAVFHDNAQMDQSFQQGTTWIAAQGGQRVLPLKESGVPVGFVQPKEGALFLPIHLFLVKNGKNTENAYKLMNYFLSEEVQKCIGPDVGFGPVREGIDVDEEIAQFFSPGDGVELAPADWTALYDQINDLSKRFSETVS